MRGVFHSETSGPLPPLHPESSKKTGQANGRQMDVETGVTPRAPGPGARRQGDPSSIFGRPFLPIHTGGQPPESSFPFVDEQFSKIEKSIINIPSYEPKPRQTQTGSRQVGLVKLPPLNPEHPPTSKPSQELAQNQREPFQEILHLQPDQIQYITPEQVRNLPPDKLQYLQRAQLEHLQPHQIGYVLPDQIKILPANKLRHLWPGQLEHLQSDQIQYITPDQIKNLPADKLQYLRPGQIRHITPKQVKNLLPAQLQYLQPDQVRHITPRQIKYLPPNLLSHVLPQTLTIAKTEAAFKTHAGADYVGIDDPDMQRELIEHSLGFDIEVETSSSGATNTVFKSTDGRKVFKPLMDIDPKVHPQALDTLRSHNIPLSPIAPLQNVKFTYEVAEHVCEQLGTRNPFLKPEFGHTSNRIPGTAYPFVAGLSIFSRPPQLQPGQWQQAFADLQTISIVATITDQSDLGLENVVWGTDGLLYVIDYDLRSGKSFATPGVLLADKPKRPTTAVGLLKTLPPRGKNIFLDGVDFASGIASETFTGPPEAALTTESLGKKRGIKLDSIQEEATTVRDLDTFKTEYGRARPLHSKLPPPRLLTNP
jgi:DNA polymerase III psi subunit